MIFGRIANQFRGEPMLDPGRIQRKNRALFSLGLGIAAVSFPVTIGLDQLTEVQKPLDLNYDYYSRADARLTDSCRSYLRDAVAHAIDPNFMRHAAYADPACALDDSAAIDGYTAEVGAVAADETAVIVTKGTNYAGLGIGVLSILIAGALVTIVKSPVNKPRPSPQLKAKQKTSSPGTVGFVADKTNDDSLPDTLNGKEAVFQPFADNPNPTGNGTVITDIICVDTPQNAKVPGKVLELWRADLRYGNGIHAPGGSTSNSAKRFM